MRNGQWGRFALCFTGLILATTANASDSFVNFETPHVNPIALSPGGDVLAVCNTPDHRLEVFDVSSGVPVSIGAIAVGYDPVSARFRTDTEVWVVNHISDTVSVVDLAVGGVVATVDTRDASNLPGGAFPVGKIPGDFGDEPTDVVFAGSPQFAYISCSQSNMVLKVDPADPGAGAIKHIEIFGEDPRAMAVSPDGLTVYVAVFESGNKSTVLAGGLDNFVTANLPNVVRNDGPYSGVNPPPNTGGVGGAFSPAINGALPTPPRVALIVKQDGAGLWRDDNGQDWTPWVSGANAAASGRIANWEVADNDVAIIDTADDSVSYATGLMNICMNLAVNPASGDIAVVGTDATNEVRFEPVLNGRFLRVNLGLVDADTPVNTSVVDLNAEHLAAAQFAQDGVADPYFDSEVPQADRDKSIGDPRGIAFNAAGTRAYITGMGSNNLVIVDATGDRILTGATVELPEGPTGIVMDDARSRAYVLNKFGASVSVVNVAVDGAESVIATVPFFDPSPEVIKLGRKHLYSTHKNSGLGQIACGSCHVDGRMDRLAWDLGDPTGDMKALDDLNLGFNISTGGFQPFHPMKGPMTTQTFQDIIGKEPFHWRGDRLGLEEFNPAFVGLQGDDVMLSPTEMQEFEDFLATIHFQPNPFRNVDNSLPTDLPLPGQFSTGNPQNDPNFASQTRGDDMPNGDATRGLELYMGTGARGPMAPFTFDSPFNCVTCHTLPLGNGPDSTFNVGTTEFDPIAVGPMGERHIGVISTDGSSNRTIKIPHLRNGYDKLGMDLFHTPSRSGFGFLHDGTVDSLTSFLSSPAFQPESDQDISDLVALMLAFSGSDFGDPAENPAFATSGVPTEPPSLQFSKDAHAAVGRQAVIDGPSKLTGLADELLALAAAGGIDLVAWWTDTDGYARAWLYAGGLFHPNQNNGAALNAAQLELLATPSRPIVFEAVPVGLGTRTALDRDDDGFYDFTEVLAGSNPASADSTPDSIPASKGWSLALAGFALAFWALYRLRARPARRAS